MGGLSVALRWPLGRLCSAFSLFGGRLLAASPLYFMAFVAFLAGGGAAAFLAAFVAFMASMALGMVKEGINSLVNLATHADRSREKKTR